MASAISTPQRFLSALSTRPINTSNARSVSHVISLSLHKTANVLKLHHLRRASSQEFPDELIGDSKFVPLNAEDPTYGPPALLLSGFGKEDLGKVGQLLKKLEGEFLEVIVCTKDMLNCSLWEVLNTKQSNLETVKAASSLPRICFLSGLTGEEMLMFIDAFPEFGIEPPVFAALVPNSADKPLQEVMEEIMGDHEMMSARQLD